MKNKVLIGLVFIMLFVISSCSKSAVKIPDGIISKDSMVFIMMDIHIAESGIKSLPPDSVNDYTKTFYEFIFKKHHITEQQFRNSLGFYTYNPELMQEIYTKMTEEMSKKEAEVYKLP